MAKGDTKTARNMISTEQARSNAQQGQLYNTIANERPDVYNRGVETRNTIQEGATNLLNNPLDQTVIDRLRAIQKPNYGASTTASATDVIDNGGGGGGESGSGGGGGGGTDSGGGGGWGGVLGQWENAAKNGLVDMGKLEAAIPGFTEISQNGGFDPTRLASIQSNIDRLKGFGTSGGFDPTAVSQIQGDIGAVRDIGRTGGFTPGGEQQIRDFIAGFGKLAGPNAGISDADMARARGGGVYDEFARTGGYSDSDVANLRARATSSIPALYATENEKLNRLASISGSSPALAAARARMIRSTGQGLADANRNAEVDIQKAIREGKLSGAKGMSDSELALQNLIQSGQVAGLTGGGNLALGLESALASNKLAGSRDAASLGTSLEGAIAANRLGATQSAMTGETNLGQNIAGNRLAGLKGITDTYGQSQGLMQQGRLAGMSGWTGALTNQGQLANQAAGIAASSAAADAALRERQREFDMSNDLNWAQLGSGNEQFIGQQGLAGRLGALGSLNSLYGTAPGETALYNNNLINLSGNQAQTNQGLIGQQLNLANQPGWFDKVMQGVGAGAGLLTAYGTSGLSVGM